MRYCRGVRGLVPSPVAFLHRAKRAFVTLSPVEGSLPLSNAIRGYAANSHAPQRPLVHYWRGVRKAIASPVAFLHRAKRAPAASLPLSNAIRGYAANSHAPQRPLVHYWRGVRKAIASPVAFLHRAKRAPAASLPLSNAIRGYAANSHAPQRPRALRANNAYASDVLYASANDINHVTLSLSKGDLAASYCGISI